MGTQLVYNGIDIGEIKTNIIETVPAYDPTGRDILYYQHTLDFNSIVYISDDLLRQNPQFDEIKSTPTEMERYIEHKLMEPRRSFVYRVDGTTLYESKPVQPKALGQNVIEYPPDTHLDANYGPMPISCRVLQVYAGSYIINFKIAFSEGLCDDIQKRRQYASNKFTTNVKIDQNGYKIATTTGRVMVNSDMRINPTSLANIVIPPIPQGYIRTAAFELSEDGLTLSYVITDKQTHTIPPLGATEAEGTFRIRSAPPGAIMYGNASVRLKGPPGSNRANLMASAILICLDKLERAGAKKIKNANGQVMPPIYGIDMSESLYDSEVTCSMEAMLFNNKVITTERSTLGSLANWFGRNLLTYGGIGIFIEGLSRGTMSRDEIAESIQNAKNAGAKVASDPSLKNAQVASQLDAFGTTPVGSPQPGFGFVNMANLSGTAFEQMVYAKFMTPCSETSGTNYQNDVPLLRGARNSQLERENNLSGQSNFGSAISSSATNTPRVNKPSGGSIVGASQGVINTPVPIGPTQPRQDLNRAFLAVGNALDEVVKGTAIAQASSIINLSESETELDDNEVPGLYTTYNFSIVEQAGDSRVVSRSTQSGGQTLAIKFGQPTRGLTLVWTASKVGFPPEIPTLADSDQFTYLNSTIDYKNMEVIADNRTPMFTMSGRISYEYTGDKDYSPSCPPPPWINLGNSQFLNVVSSKTNALSIADS